MLQYCVRVLTPPFRCYATLAKNSRIIALQHIRNGTAETFLLLYADEGRRTPFLPCIVFAICDIFISMISVAEQKVNRYTDSSCGASSNFSAECESSVTRGE